MQDADDADLSTQAFRVRGYFQKRCGSGSKQQVVEAARVFECKHVQLMRHAEDDVEVSSRQHFLFAGGNPALARLRLTLWAMPVTARVIGDGPMTALRARIEMAAQSCCAAVLDGTEYSELLKAEARSISLKKAGALCAKKIGHLQGRARHRSLLRMRRSLSFTSERLSSSIGLTPACRCFCDRCRY